MTHTKGFVNLVNINDSSCNDRTMSIKRPPCFFNLWSSCPAAQSSASRAAYSCLPWPAMLPRRPHRTHTTPTAGQAIPPLTQTPCYSAATATSHCSRTSEPSYSSPRGLPLLHLPRLRIVSFLGLSVVHRPGALNAAWSMWSTTDFHQKSTVRGEAYSWVHGGRKEVPPYYVENNYSST